jgi:hypothetical protein
MLLLHADPMDGSAAMDVEGPAPPPAPSQPAKGVTRGDGRTSEQLRPPLAELGLLNQADGSARFVQVSPDWT